MYVYNGDDSVNNQALTIKAVGETKGYYFGGNPFGLDEFYDAARDAINPEINNFYKMTFTAIRNAAASRLTITDSNGKVLSGRGLLRLLLQQRRHLDQHPVHPEHGRYPQRS